MAARARALARTRFVWVMAALQAVVIVATTLLLELFTSWAWPLEVLVGLALSLGVNLGLSRRILARLRGPSQ
jgi:hypothetical protein